MSEPAKKIDKKTESYSPKTKPELLNQIEAAFPGFSVYKNILYSLNI